MKKELGKGGTAVAAEAMKESVLRFAKEQNWNFKISGNGGMELVPEFCPVCNGGDNGDRRSFAINLRSGLSCCKRGSCGWEGNFIGLQRKIGVTDDRIIEASSPYTKNALREIKRRSYVRPSIELAPPTDKIVDYFEKRKISRKTLDAFRIGTVAPGHKHSGDIVFPFYMDSGSKDLIFVKYRRPEKWTKNSGFPKEVREPNTMSILFGMDMCVTDQPLILTEGQCFLPDAELLTETGDWVSFRDYDGTTPIMTVEDSKAPTGDSLLFGKFVRPLAVIKKPYNGAMRRIETIETKSGKLYNSVTTPDHNILVMDRLKGRFEKVRADKVGADRFKAIPLTVAMVDMPGTGLTPEEITIQIAMSSHGVLLAPDRDGNSRGLIILPTEMRGEFSRLSRLFTIAKIPGVKRRRYQESPSETSYVIEFDIPKWMQNLRSGLTIPKQWIGNATWHERLLILREFEYWYRSGKAGRKIVDVIQAIAHTCGYVAAVKRLDRPLQGKGGTVVGGGRLTRKEYSVRLSAEDRMVPTEILEMEDVPYDGDVHCVTVPSGLLLVRQNGVISVSGNCDAMALYEAGIRNVVSVPSGAMDFEWIEHCLDWMEEFPEIIIFGDNDEPGREMVDNLLRRFSGMNCKVVKSFPLRPGTDIECKDANEVLFFHGDLVLWDMIDNAEGTKLRGVINLADVVPIDPTTIPRIKTNIPGVDKTLGGLQAGTVTLFTGNAGSGKSTVTGQFILSAVEQGEKACIYSGELGAEDVQAWLNFQAAGSEYITLKYDPVVGDDVPFVPNEVQTRIRSWYDEKLYLFDDSQFEGESQMDAILEVFRMSARRLGAKLFLLDNVLTVTAEDNEEFRAQGKLITQLKHFAKRYGVSVLLVAHPRKKSSNATSRIIAQDDVGGNGALVRLADNVIVVERPNLRIIKNRKMGVNRLIECVYCPDSRRIYERLEGDRNIFSWDKEGIEPPAIRADSREEYREYISVENMPF